MGIGVIGEQLHVREVRATLDGRKPGAQARISLWQHGDWRRWVTGWKHTKSVHAGGRTFQVAKWRINKRFPHNSQLCAAFAHEPDRLACAKIHK
ncbi:hypothetical protein [Streptomyces coffeae]|uniref:hypothetical protein n=1 Tax=Streptomyces coffeae TaxID=621382 RepID=UPI0027DE5936|nr:hypothetical protein [Streptomyces coffeae]